MKISKFKESIENETWTQAKFDKIAAMKKYIHTEENELLLLLIKYLILNPEIIRDFGYDDNLVDNQSSWVTSYELLDNPKYKMIILYYPNKDYNESLEVGLTHKQFKDLLIFLKNPDTYSDIKKYNL